MKREQRRTKDISLHEAVMHKADCLAEEIRAGRIPRGKLYGVLICAMGQAFQHGVQHGMR